MEEERKRREEERRQRRLEREKKMKEEEEAYAAERKRREEERERRRQERLKRLSRSLTDNDKTDEVTSPSVDDDQVFERSTSQEPVTVSVESLEDEENKMREERRRKREERRKQEEEEEKRRSIQLEQEYLEEQRKKEEEKRRKKEKLQKLREEEERLRKLQEEEELEEEMFRKELEEKERMEAEEAAKEEEEIRRLEKERQEKRKQEEEEEKQKEQERINEEEKQMEEEEKRKQEEERNQQEEHEEQEKEEIRAEAEREEEEKKHEEEEKRNQEEERKQQEEEQKRKEEEEKRQQEEAERIQQEEERKKREEEEERKKKQEEEEKQKLEEDKRKQEEEKRQQEIFQKQEEERQQKEIEERMKQMLEDAEFQKRQEELQKRKEREEQKKKEMLAEKERTEKERQQKRLQEEQEAKERQQRLQNLMRQSQIALSTEEFKQMEGKFLKRNQEIQKKEEVKRNVLNLYHPNVSQYFDKLSTLARSAGNEVSNPEFVFVSLKRKYQNDLIESFLGLNLQLPEINNVVYFHMVQVANSDNLTIKLKQTNGSPFAQVNSEDLSTKLIELKESEPEQPIHVRCESNSFGFDFTLICAKPLENFDAVDKEVIQLLRPIHRFIVFVEADGVFDKKPRILPLLDPCFKRTISVYTNFQKWLSSESLPELNRLMKLESQKRVAFWIPLSLPEDAKKDADSDSFHQLLMDAEKNLRKDFFFHGFDKSLFSLVGIFCFREYILSKAWSTYKDTVATVLSSFYEKKKEIEGKISAVKEKRNQSLSIERLRFIANKYVISFLQNIQSLLDGTAKFNFPGQTLVEEKDDQGHFRWMSQRGFGSEIGFDTPEWNSSHPLFSQRLFGAQQFKRLILEFQEVMKKVSFPEISQGEIGAISGLQNPMHETSTIRMGCEIAQREIDQMIRPIILDVLSRCLHIQRKNAEIAELEAKQFDYGDYPILRSYVRELFFKFVDHAGKRFIQECDLEFYSAQTLFWDLKRQRSTLFNQKDVMKVASSIFETSKERIARRTVMMICKWFIFTCLHRTDGWGEIESSVNMMTQEDLLKTFQVNYLGKSLESEELSLKQEFEKLEKKEEEIKNHLLTFPALDVQA